MTRPFDKQSCSAEIAPDSCTFLMGMPEFLPLVPLHVRCSGVGLGWLAMAGVEQLRVRLLGGLDVDGVDERSLGSRKARTLIKVLALGRGLPVGVDKIVDALWPGDDAPAKPADQVGVLVSRLRAVLGADRLTRSEAGWTLHADWLDITELEARVDEAAARLGASSPVAARAAVRAALTLVRGELLADELDPLWADADRAAVARVVARARVIGAEAAVDAGDPGDAASMAEGALDHDPYDEAALRVLMRAHAAAGRPASALAAYARVRARLAEELGVDPGSETEELHTAILLGDVATTTESVPAGSAAAPAIVGRRAELAMLDGHLTEAARGAAAAVVIEGEAGIGKTALIRAWLPAAATRATVLVGRCDALGRGLPLQPLLDALAAHLRQLTHADTRTVLGGAASTLTPLLGPVAAAAPSRGQPTTVADPVIGQALLFADLLAAIERAGGGRPVVVIVEDIHLAARSTVEWLRYAVQRGQRLLVLASTRPGEGTPLDGAHVIRLGPLDLDAVTELVGKERAVNLFERSGGLPLFLVELAAAGDEALPESVREAVAASVEELGAAARTLRTAAVLGSEIDVDLLAGILGAPFAVLLAHVDAGVRARIIEERSDALAFRHDLVREALAAGTTATRRSFVHREAARVLHERPHSDPLQVAWHAQRGGDLGMAASALTAAAALASDRHDTALAEQLLGQAIDLTHDLDALLARARVRIARWDIAGAHADTSAALSLGGGASALEVAAWVEYYGRDYDRAYRFAEEAVARSDDPGLRASCLAMSGRVSHARGDLVAAEARLVEAVDTAPTPVRGFAQVWLGGLRAHQGRTEDACDLIERAFTERRWLGHPFAAHHGHMFRSLSLGQRGLVVEAFQAVDDARADAIAMGEPGARFIHVADNVSSWLLRGVGRIEEAEERSQRVLDGTSADGSPSTNEMRHAALLDLIEGPLLCGDLDGAARAIEAGAPVETMHGTMAWHHRQRYWVQQARFALAIDDAGRASELTARAIDDAQVRGSLRYELLATVVAARAAAAEGAPFDHAALETALAKLEHCGSLEAWLVTAELGAATGVDRWWRDAERRAGALVAGAAEHAEPLRRWIGQRFAALGRS